MSASIRLNGSTTPLVTTTGTVVTLSNFSNTGVLGWLWALLDAPEGSSSSISAPNAAAPTVTGDKIGGTYLVQLTTYKDAARTIIDSSDTAAIEIAFADSPTDALPAAGETREVDPNKGWKPRVNRMLAGLHDGSAGGMFTAIANPIGAVALHDVVRAGGDSGGYPVMTTMNALSAFALTDPLFIVIGKVGGGTISPGDKIICRRSGYVTGLTIAGSPAANAVVYLADAGGLSGSPGTAVRPLGRVSSPTTTAVNFDGDYTTPTTPYSQTLFAWNETDATQFQVSIDQIAGGGVVLSKQSNARGPRLRVAFPTKSAVEQATFITIHGLDLNALTSKGSGRFRYVWEFDVLSFSGDGVTNAQWYAIGPAFLCTDVTTGFFGLAYGAGVGGTSARGVVCKNDVVTFSGDTPVWPQIFPDGDAVDRLVHFRLEIEVVKNGGSQPFFLVNLWCRNSSNTAAILDRTADSVWNSIATFSSAWNALSPVTLGIMIMSAASGTTANQYFEFAHMRVSKHSSDL